MIESVPFQTRARTIDHLGRGQIADAPTAVSELWKNAYDAYARNVALHIFDGTPEIGAIFDDGVGMTHDDVIRRWLVIGTESKIEDFEATPPETLGLPGRPRQGEKGIGRLSVAFLAPGTVLVSKRSTSDYVVVVVDWRLFENPFVILDDIRLPVEQYPSAEALIDGLPLLVGTLKLNLGDDSSERGKRLLNGWEKFSEYERKQGSTATTADAIKESWVTMPLSRKHFEEWPVFLDLTSHGTAIFMVGLNHELRVWVRPSEAGEEVEEVKERLRQTLTGFTDPYSNERPDFDYEVFIHTGDSNIRLIGTSDVFGLEEFRDLEHYIEGSFDDMGKFTGRVVAFGQDLGVKTFMPRQALPARGRDRLGPFTFAIGTLEIDERRSTHDANQHAFLVEQARRFAGVSVYRDYLRVMPYGRPDADFLEMEERRSKSAGREFWAHRRCFGRIGFSRIYNPSLKDKAGREGLVDNRAFREMRLLIIDFLMDAARKYFGTDSPVRKELLPSIMERKALQKEAASQARARRRKGMRQFLREQSGPLDAALTRADSLLGLAKNTLSTNDRVQATVLMARTQELTRLRDTLRPPTPPSRLGDLEEKWRVYRDSYEVLLGRVTELSELAAQVDAKLQGEAPSIVLKRRYDERSKDLDDQLRTFGFAIDERLETLREVWHQRETEDATAMADRVGYLLEAEVTVDNLIGMLNLLDVNRTELSEAFANKYQSFLSTLNQLIEGIDLEGAYSITEDDRAELEEQLNDIRSIAQVGITVEIIGHEFESLESEVRHSLGKLPSSARDTVAYRQALRAHLAFARPTPILVASQNRWLSYT